MIRYDVSLSMRLLRAVPVLIFYIGLAALILTLTPPDAWAMCMESLVVVGIIGTWRYLWLLTHVIRAAIFEHLMFPKIRFAADSLPEDEKYPQRLFFIIPTFGEKPEVSRQMLSSVLDESARIPTEVTIIVNAGSEEEDSIFRSAFEQHSSRDNVRMIFIRQRGGKRQGMADCLYAMTEMEIDDGDGLVLMDGDTVLGKGILGKCLPLFALRPELSAVTTDNISVTKGNFIYRKWYTLRFSLRHRMMKSQSLSNQLLVLTGRFSVFRAKQCVTEEFIAHLENDRIKHWLHGDIPFVTGDDKSTWFCLLRQGKKMLYVPDTHIYCMEDSGDQPLRQSVKKMHRWFGNMLRNNGRAIRLGMGRQSPFLWWCHVDQRISMWTSLLGPCSALWAACWLSPWYLVVYALVVIAMRMIYVMLLTLEGHRLSLFDLPLLLYTQWIGSLVKIHTMFHLHRQAWDAHRRKGGAQANVEPALNRLIPKMQIAFSFTLLLLFVAMIVGVK
jgi:glycosyltransferase Alg8